MFQTSHPFAFFDYFRVPYEVLPPHDGNGLSSSPSPVHWLRSDAGDQPPRSLLWPAAETRAAPPGYRLGLFSLAGFTFSAPVALNATAQAILARRGDSWRPVEPVLDGDERCVAAVWRDSAGNVFLPFDPGEAMLRFWSEEYRNVGRAALATACHGAALRGYYALRPLVPRPVQMGFRRTVSRVQGKSAFPRWPVEDSLDSLYRWLFGLVASVAGRPVPFLDLWPGGRSWALVLTHDVETAAGCRDIELLRGPERERGYRSSWNFCPGRYHVEDEMVAALVADGCEVGVHGLRHDGRDLASRRMANKRLPMIREHAERWQAVGFRSPSTQRAWDLMPLLGFDYDSSYPDCDPYEPQPGGCCSYLPYFNRAMVELPITLPQDHTLFAILDHPDAELWLRKAEHIRQRGGMALMLTHPDYAQDPRLATAYRQLLDAFSGDGSAWHALPKEVAAWWRRRTASSLRETSEGWRIAGPAAVEGRVRLADASGIAASPRTVVTWPEAAANGHRPSGSQAVATAPARKRRASWQFLPRGPAAARKASHVLLVVENVPLGIDPRAGKQVKDLLAHGYRVSAVTQRDPANASYRQLPGLTVLEYPAPSDAGGVLGYAREYGSAFAWATALSVAVRLRDRIDVAQFSQPPDVYFPLAWLLRLCGTKIVVDQRDLMPELFAARYENPGPTVLAMLRWLERRTQRVAHHTIGVNGYLRDRLVGAGASPGRVAVVRNGPLLSRVGQAVADPALREDHRFLCCWTGKMGRQDRVDLLLCAIAHVVHELGRTDCGFAILGDGETLEELRSQSRQLGLEPWVKLPGWLTEQQVFTYLATADLGLDTSLQAEVSPVKVMEYMAFGLPFVAFDLPETRVIGAGAAALVPPGDAERVAAEIVALLDDPARRAQMGQAGRWRVQKQLAWERQAPVYLDVIGSLCDHSQAPGGQPREAPAPVQASHDAPGSLPDQGAVSLPRLIEKD